MDSLEACGPTARKGFYQLTFEDEEDADKFVEAGDFELKGRKCIVDRVRLHERDRRFRVRVHWVPHYIPNEVITKTMRISVMPMVSSMFTHSHAPSL